MTKVKITRVERPPIVLDPQRSGDRHRLARLLALIAWRLAREERTATSQHIDKSVLDLDT